MTENEDRRRAESMPTDITIEPGRRRLNSGVILLAQHLLSTTSNGKMDQDASNMDRKTRAFTFPPEQLDMQYKTIPEGVKPFPTPPETPASPPVAMMTRPVSDGNLVRKRSSVPDEFHSETSSVSSFAIDDEHVERIFMKSPRDMMKEIDHVFDRVQNSAEQSEEDSGCSVRTSCATATSTDLLERASASGAEETKDSFGLHSI